MSFRERGKWIWISILIGGISGIGAIAFFTAIHLFTRFFLGEGVGIIPPDAAGEGTNIVSPSSVERLWLLPIVTMFGGLLSGIIVYIFAKETQGHGTDAAIDAFHQGDDIRTRVPFIKLVASAITIGTGGSAGREGPIAQICAGIGSVIANVLKLEQQEKRYAVVIGMGAGIGAIFHAPIGGAIVATEFLYKEDMERKPLIPALIAALVSYGVFSSWIGFQPLFKVSVTYLFSIQENILFIILGIICGLGGLCYIAIFYGCAKLFKRLSIADWVKPGIGGLLVGLIAIYFPQILGLGDGWLQVGMNNGFSSFPLWVICLLPFLKMLATGLSVGSGGSGGIFGPGIVIGGFLGVAVWSIYHQIFPESTLAVGSFIIVGMIALFAGVAHAPIGMVLLGVEMTNSLSMLIPAMLASCLSIWIVGRETIYRKQRDTKKESPAHSEMNG